MLSVNRKNLNSKNLHSTENSKKAFNQYNSVAWIGCTNRNKIDDR